jgi:hypothetical protein
MLLHTRRPPCSRFEDCVVTRTRHAGGSPQGPLLQLWFRFWRHRDRKVLLYYVSIRPSLFGEASHRFVDEELIPFSYHFGQCLCSVYIAFEGVETLNLSLWCSSKIYMHLVNGHVYNRCYGCGNLYIGTSNVGTAKTVSSWRDALVSLRMYPFRLYMRLCQSWIQITDFTVVMVSLDSYL